VNHIATRAQFARNLGSGWALLAAEVLVAFFLTPFIIHKLGAAAYGVWSLMIGLIGYMGLIDVGLRGALGRYINHYLARADRVALDEVVGTASVVLTGLATVALLGALVLGENFTTVFPKTPPGLASDIRFALPLLAMGLWLSFMSAILGNLLGAKEAMYMTNGFNLFTLAVRTAGVVAVLGSGHGIAELVMVTLGTGLLGIGLTFWAVRRVYGGERPRMVGFSAERLKEMWRFGIASFVSRTASTMANDSAPIIGMWILGPEAVAVYSVALTLTQNARRLQDVANTAIFPSVMKAGAVKDLAGLRVLYLRFMDVSFAIGSLVFVALMVFSWDFLRLWVGPQFVDGGLVVSVLAFGYLMQGIASTAPITLQSMDRIGITVKIGLWEALACVALTAALPGLLGLGLLGMALGTTLPRLASNVLVYPRLTIDTLGDELRAALPRAVARNLLLCSVMAVLFVALHLMMPGRSWPMLLASVGVACGLHLLLVGSAYPELPLIGPIGARLRKRAWRQP
jgi:O-antigen/teichoic acid export membrane protein